MTVPLTFLRRPDGNYGVFRDNKIIASALHDGATYRIVPERHWSGGHEPEIKRTVAAMNARFRLLGE